MTYKDLNVYWTFVFESAGFLQSIGSSMQRSFKACVYFAMHHFFKAKCAINCYWVISCLLCALYSDFICMAKSMQNLDLNIVISKCWSIGVAPLERT